MGLIDIISGHVNEAINKNEDLSEKRLAVYFTDCTKIDTLFFEEEEHDFGRITQGEKVSYAFKFKNTGKSNLLIASAAGSCGCTVPEYPKEPILPGQEAKINVVFSSEGKSGIQEKTITIVTNCEPSTKIIKIKTNIIVPETVKDNGF